MKCCLIKGVSCFGNLCLQTASSLACAQKGWVSVDLDKLQCEYCGSILQYSPPEDSLNPLEGQFLLL